MPRSGSRGRSNSSRGYIPAQSRPPSPPPPPPPPRQGPSLAGQAAAVAGGIAAGNLMSAALLGPRVVVVEDGGKGNANAQQQTAVDPCAKELQNFVECARTTRDLRDCEGLNEVLKVCRRQYGLPPDQPPR